MSDRLRSLLHRPLEDRERLRLFATAGLVLLAGAIALVLLTGRDPLPATAHHAPHPAAPAPVASASPSGESGALGPAGIPSEEGHSREANRIPPTELPQLRDTARTFLAGYLPYTYAQRPASAIRMAMPALLHQLAAEPPHVPPAIRRRHPRVQFVQVNAAGRRAASVTAMVSDGAIHYTVALELVLVDAGWRVRRTG